MQNIVLTSIETFENKASVAFTCDSAQVFREDKDVVPIILSDKISYIPWGDLGACNSD